MRDRIPGLDGLRAGSALLVVAFHFWPDTFPGGFIGVDVFFVISGYLITDQLLRPGRRFGEFMARRVARLWPALLALCGLVVALDVVAGRSPVPGVVSALYAQVPVWRWTGGTVYLPHTWSLAVEMQFYLAWAAFLTLARPSRRTVLLVACWVAGGSLVAAEVVAVAGETVTPFYLTPTRLTGLLVGAAMAAASRAVVARVAWLSLAVVPAVWFTAAGDWQGSITAGSPLGVAVGAGLTAVCVTRAQWAVALLDCGAARYWGERSYSLYLWHPIALFLTGYHTPLGPILAPAAALVLSLVAADVSFRMVERPGRRRFTAILGRWTLRRSDHVAVESVVVAQHHDLADGDLRR